MAYPVGTGTRFLLGLQTPSSGMCPVVILAMSVAIQTVLGALGAVLVVTAQLPPTAAATNTMWPAIEGLLFKRY